jgi:hypothetical protein
MRSTQQKAPASPRQTTIALDSKSLWGMTTIERKAAVRALARLLLEAAETSVGESRDDHG